MTTSAWTTPVAILFFSMGALPQVPAAAGAAARQGKVDAALSALEAAPRSADADALRCRLYASIEQRDLAVKACEAAAAASPSNSSYALELARAYGAKADSGGALTGMRMVGRIRENFERAVRLDGSNVEALSDLGQFYVEAPAIVGGGLDKARALVARLQALSPARAHRLAAMIAVKDKDQAVAEREYQAELNVAHTAEAYVDLANYERSRKASDLAAKYAAQAIEHDPHHGPDTLDAASILLDLRRDTPTLQKGVQAYLDSVQEVVASYARAHLLMGRSLRAAGDTQGAAAQFQAALALAGSYAAARQGLAQ